MTTAAPPIDDQPGSQAPPARTDSLASTNPFASTVGAGVAVVGILFTATQWSAIYADQRFLIPQIAAALLAATVTIVLARRRLPAAAALLVSIAATTAILAAMAVQDGGDSLSDLGPGLINSWKAVATTGLLLPTTASFLVVPVISTTASAWLAVASLSYRRSPAFAVLGVLGSWSVAVAYTASQRLPPVEVVAVVIASCLLLLVAAGLHGLGDASFGNHNSSQINPGRLISAGLMVALLTAAGCGLFTLLNSSTPFDLRDRLVRPIDVAESATPLARIKAGLVDSRDDTVAVVNVEGLNADDSIDRLRVAVLDRFDGVVWSTGARFEAAGAVLPAPTDGATSGPGLVEYRQVDIRVTDDYPFRFLPTPGIISDVEVGSLAWDPRTGMVAPVDPAEQNFAGTAQLDRRPTKPDGAALASLAADGTEPTTNSTAVRPSVPSTGLSDDQRIALSRYLAEVAEPGDDAVVILGKVYDDLASERFGYNPEAPAGHSLAAVLSYLASDAPVDPNEAADEGASRVGSAEHAAAALAVVAAELDLPSRVIVGYQLVQPLSAATPTATVGETAIHAWTEVWLSEQGWVVLDPTNKTNASTHQPSRTPAVTDAGAGANPTELPELEEPTLLAPDPVGAASSRWRLLAMLGLLPVGYVIGVVGIKKLRRRRRFRRDSPNKSVVGAWHEVQDRLVELGLPIRGSLSAHQTSDELALIDRRDVGEPILDLSSQLDQALYAVDPVTRPAADAAWEAADRSVKAARGHATRGQRVRAAVDPRTLRSWKHSNTSLTRVPLATDR